MSALAAHPDLSRRARDVLQGLLDYDAEETVAREIAEDYLATAERHVEIHEALERQTGDRGVSVTEHAGWPEWREAADMLAATGEAVLSNRERYGAYLDAMTSGKARARLTVEQPSNRLRHGRAVTPEPRVAQAASQVDPERKRKVRPHSGRLRKAQGIAEEGRAAGPQGRQAPSQKPGLSM